MMIILMDENVCGFSLKEANNCRKICSKKKMNEIPKLHELVLSKAKSTALGKYVWDTAILPQMGYSFSLIHSLAYSFVGIQTIYLSTFYNPVYWNTACLRVDSGLDEDSTSNYNKISKAVCNIVYRGIEVKPVDINKSQYMFTPDAESNSILYGMKGLNGVGSADIAQIVENRPYDSFADFTLRTNIDKTATVSLIKAGAFDEFDTRENIMRQYLFTTCNPKKRITLQNFAALVDHDLVPQQLNFQKRLFVFNKSLKANCVRGTDYIIKGRYYKFYEQFFDVDELAVRDNELYLPQAKWKKMYDKGMTKAKEYLKDNQSIVLDRLNTALLSAEWDKYADGNISSWEMESMGFYAHDHELADLAYNLYGISEFRNLPIDPVVEKEYNGIPIRKLTRIAGCVIAKDDMKNTLTLLTPESGVVNVKFTQERYAEYNRRISQVMKDGTKKVIDPSWFTRGTLVVINGFRRQDMFVAKTYKSTKHQMVEKIVKANSNGTIEVSERRAEA